MSRIGKQPITIPAGVEFTLNKDNSVKIKGAKGTLIQKFDPDFIFELNDSTLTVQRPTEQKRHKALHGLYRSLLSNMVQGVSDGFKVSMDLVGVGYRVSNQGQLVEIMVGYSHPIYFYIPEEIKITTSMEKGAPPRITMECFDKQLLGQVAAKLRKLRKPEPYKGKGIKFSDEILRRKAGKSSGKK